MSKTMLADVLLAIGKSLASVTWSGPGSHVQSTCCAFTDLKNAHFQPLKRSSQHLRSGKQRGSCQCCLCCLCVSSFGRWSSAPTCPLLGAVGRAEDAKVLEQWLDE